MNNPQITQALAFFSKTDPIIYSVVQGSLCHSSPLILPVEKSVEDYFPTLVRSIVSQQISTKAAATIYARLLICCNTISVDAIKERSQSELLSCGLSQAKVRYIVNLAHTWDALEPASFVQLNDTEITARLVKCLGIGQWTAEMFLIFAMNRPDVFSLGDLGLRNSISQLYGVAVDDLPSIRSHTDRWAPHRTVAALALWHQLDNGPVLL